MSAHKQPFEVEDVLREARQVRNRGMLNATDPEFLREGAIAVWIELIKSSVWPLMGRVLSLDGAFFPSHRAQRQSVSIEDEIFLNDGLRISYGKHGETENLRRATRGRHVISLTESVGPVIVPFVWSLPAADSEYLDLESMLERFFLTAMRNRLYSDVVDVRIILADRGFNVRPVHEILLYKFGQILITPWRNPRAGDWIDNEGIPYCWCAQDAAGDPVKTSMRRKSEEGFPLIGMRESLGLKPGEDIRHHPKWGDNPVVHYECIHGNKRESIVVTEDNLHIVPYVPYGRDPLVVADPDFDDSAFTLYKLRAACTAHRNAAESFNSIIKRDGLGLKPPMATKCISSDRQYEFWLYSRVLALGLRRLVAINGDVDKMIAVAQEGGLLRPGLRARWEALGLDHLLESDWDALRTST